MKEHDAQAVPHRPPPDTDVQADAVVAELPQTIPTEAEALSYEISDEALEATAGSDALANWTMFCTGIQCPG
jgi:hypothetical protein